MATGAAAGSTLSLCSQPIRIVGGIDGIALTKLDVLDGSTNQGLHAYKRGRKNTLTTTSVLLSRSGRA